MSQKYYVTYEVTPHSEGITKDQIPEGHGGCDSIMIFSIMGTPGSRDQGLSILPIGLDGRTEEDLPPEQQFMLWTVWAHTLMETLPPGGRRDLVAEVHETVRRAFLYKIEEKCEECGAGIPDTVGGSLANKHHAPSCSLYEPYEQ